VYDKKRKASDLDNYQRQDAEKKYNEIKKLLVQMNVPVNGDKKAEDAHI
jgi:hypothetical protein